MESSRDELEQRTAELAELNQRLKQEISHRRRAEEANATYAAIVEHSNDAIIGQKRDVTEQRRVEDALRETQAKATAILDTAVDAIITIDQIGTIESFNRAAERVFGYSADEVMGKNVRMLMPDPDRSAHDTYMRNYM